MKTYPWLFSKKYQRVLTEADWCRMSLRKTLYLYVKKKKGIMDFEGECNTRTASVFQLKRKRGKDSFNAESNSRFFWRFSMEAQTEKRIDNPRFIYPYHGLAIRLLLSGGKKRLINIALLRVLAARSSKEVFKGCKPLSIRLSTICWQHRKPVP